MATTNGAKNRKSRRKKRDEDKNELQVTSNIPQMDVPEARAIIQRLQAKYKHKLEEGKENSVPLAVQIISETETTCPSPTKMAKVADTEYPDMTSKSPTNSQISLEEHREVGNSKISPKKDESKKVVCCKVSTARSDLVGNERLCKPKTSKISTAKTELVCNERLHKTKTPETSSPTSDKRESNCCTPSSSVSALDSFDYLSPKSTRDEAETKRPNYMRILDFKTPVIERKKPRRRIGKKKDQSKKTEEEWIAEMNKEFEEVDKYELTIQ